MINANYNDLGALQNLRLQAGNDPAAASREVAQQFEALFINMMLKTMRDSLPQDSLFGSNTMQFQQSMFDQQIAMELSAKGGIGLAEIIEEQLRFSQGL